MEHLKLYNVDELLNDAAKDILYPVEGIKIEGWSDFNEYTGGLRPNEFTIFCGATGIGKTQFLANMAASLIKQGVKTFCAPVETGAVDLMRRILSINGGYDFNTGEKPNATMIRKLKDTLATTMGDVQKNLLVTTYDNRVDVNELILNLKYLTEVREIKVAILDNLNFFMKPTRAQDTVLEYDEVVHNFVMLAKKLPIHIILVMHPKKTDSGKVESEFDIKGSSTAVQEATNVLLMNRLKENEMVDGLTPFDRELVFRKIRRRGFYVGRKFYMRSDAGKYINYDPNGTQQTHQTKNGRTSSIIGARPESFLGSD